MNLSVVLSLGETIRVQGSTAFLRYFETAFSGYLDSESLSELGLTIYRYLALVLIKIIKYFIFLRIVCPFAWLQAKG